MIRSLLSRRAFAGLSVMGIATHLSGLRSRAAAAEAPPGDVAGAERSTKSTLLATGAAVLQSKAPLDAMNLYLDGFHFYADDIGRQVEAHHYCTHLNEDVHQCVIYDSNGAEARLIGIEYIVSARLFETLPDEEKPLWHSHRYEVTSGLLVMPGIPTALEREAMASLVGTYGKTWHTWQIDRGDPLPLGIPQLMMGFTSAGQVDGEKVRARDARFGFSTEEVRQSRSDIPVPAAVAGADAWQSGRTPQLCRHDVPVRQRP